MGLGVGFPQPVVFPPASSGSPQSVGVSLGFPQAAVPLSTVGLVGEAPPQPDEPADTRMTQVEVETDTLSKDMIIYLNASPISGLTILHVYRGEYWYYNMNFFDEVLSSKNQSMSAFSVRKQKIYVQRKCFHFRRARLEHLRSYSTAADYCYCGLRDQLQRQRASFSLETCYIAHDSAVTYSEH